MSVYNSPRRAEAAAGTQQAILAAARRLFAEKGYAATTIGDIAQAARVAPATIYTSVGGKQRLLEELARTSAADDTLGGFVESLRHTHDPHEVLRLAVAATRYSAERNADLFAIIRVNAPFDETVAAIAAESDRWFRSSARKVAARLRDLRVLRGSLAEGEDAVTYFLGHDSWHRAITDFGWSYGKAEKWFTARLAEALLSG